MPNKIRLCWVLALMLLGSNWASAALLNPGTSYLSFQDSPFWSDYQAGNFSGPGEYFFLENFEDGVLDTPNVQIYNAESTPYTYLNPSTYTDSVDADVAGDVDNWQSGDTSNVNGFGTDGTSIQFRSQGGITQATFIFNPGGTLNLLPTHVGLVWTDGRDANRNPAPVEFEAFDGLNNSLGIVTKNGLADNSHIGETDEDRFLGAIGTSNGISKIRISTTTGGFELDHLQYGLVASPTAPPPPAVPEPSTLLLVALVLFGLPLVRAQRKG